MMKTAFRCVQIVLLFYGVFGADEDEVKAVSVMEGDSVTLPTDLTQKQTFYLIEWRFGDPIIAQTDGKDISYPHDIEIFRGRLQLDLTGSLTIKNIKTKHSGLYQLKISRSDGTAERKFNVTVYESPFVIDPGESEMRSVPVKEGDRVTLQTGVTQISGDELIVWRFGDEGKLIAKADIEAKSSPLYYDERFRDRLELNKTGSLIITNTRSTDSGFYSVKISSRTQTVYKRFSVTVIEPGLSPGAVAGIVLLFLAAVAAAAAAGFIYYRRKISELRKQTLNRVYVTEGESVHLSTDRPKIERDDEIQWMFGDEIIAEIKEGTGKTHDDGAAGRFRDRLQLDKRTGDLTIKNFTAKDEGDYKLKIRSRKGNTNWTYSVRITVSRVSVTAGDSVCLATDRPKIKRDDVIQWRFRDEIIAEIKGGTGETHDGPDERFRDRLQLDKRTGDLTIKNCTDKHEGRYKLKIISRKGDTNRTYGVTITVSRVSVTVGESVHLSTGRPKIERDDVIQWMFGDEIIAEVKGGTGETHDGAAGRFRDRLQLNDQTGDLTIKNSTAEDEGYYKLKISNSKGNTNWTYGVTITVKRVSVTVGESVHLFTDRPKIERDDEIQWRCGDEIIAEIKGGTGETHDGAAGRFRDRLQLDDQTGDLTIKNSTAEDTGRYNLKIRSSKGNTNKTYSVIITVAIKPRKELPVKGNNDESVVEMQPLMIK